MCLEGRSLHSKAQKQNENKKNYSLFFLSLSFYFLFLGLSLSNWTNNLVKSLSFYVHYTQVVEEAYTKN